MSHDVVVVGSINRDLVVRVPTIPRPGETLLAQDHRWGDGGKGANQAVAAARLGAAVGIVGRVGSDSDGDQLLDGLRAEGVDVAAVARDNAGTGIACVFVDAKAENSIVVSAGANGAVSRADVEAHAELLRAAPVTLVQLEVPLEAVHAAVTTAEGTVILNPAPAVALDPDLLRGVDILVPNRLELGVLVDAPAPETADACRALAERIPVRVQVITLGAEGALILHDGVPRHIPAPPVEPVDTTGAGDTFCGALAHGLAEGLTLTLAVGRAVQRASASTLIHGARPGVRQGRSSS